MQLIENWLSALKLGDLIPIREPDPLIHSFQTAGTRFPIFKSRLETERWLSTSAPMGMNPPTQIGIASLTGKRPNNEDTALVFLSQIDTDDDLIPVCFAVVADGIGGRWGGEYASSVAAQTVAECVIDQIILREIGEKSARPDRCTVHDALNEAMIAAHKIVRSHIRGSGTTATCVLIVGDEAQIAHIGDSRAYLMTHGELQLLTRDHSLVHLLEERGSLNPQHATTHTQRSFLYRSIGMKGNFEVDSLCEPLEPASLMLLCSDGLWHALDDQKIAETIIVEGDPQTACQRLVEMGAHAGDSENVTAVIVQTSE